MTSTEQSQTIENSTTEKAEVGNGDKAVEQSQQLNEGEHSKTYSEEEYKKLQKEYTKSRQELSEIKKETELSPEDKAAIDFIKKHGFVTQDDLSSLSQRQEADNNLRDILSANPDLQPFESAIKELGTSTDMAYEDIIQKYGFA